MSDCDHSDISAPVAASIRQSIIWPTVFSVCAVIALAAAFVVAPGVQVAIFAGAGLGLWLLIQVLVIIYLRQRPAHAAVSVPVIAATVVALGALALSFADPGLGGGIAVGGAFLACGAIAEIMRGRKWRTDIAEDTEAGDAARLLAVNGGYDGTPFLHFLLAGVLTGLWVVLVGSAWWAFPFAWVAHLALGLWFAVKAR